MGDEDKKADADGYSGYCAVKPSKDGVPNIMPVMLKKPISGTVNGGETFAVGPRAPGSEVNIWQAGTNYVASGMSGLSSQFRVKSNQGTDRKDLGTGTVETCAKDFKVCTVQQDATDIPENYKQMGVLSSLPKNWANLLAGGKPRDIKVASSELGVAQVSGEMHAEGKAEPGETVAVVDKRGNARGIATVLTCK